MAIGREQGVLQGVGRVLTVAGGAQRDRPEAIAVTTYELRERVPVSRDVRGEQRPVLRAGVLRAGRIVRGAGHARQGTGVRRAGR